MPSSVEETEEAEEEDEEDEEGDAAWADGADAPAVPDTGAADAVRSAPPFPAPPPTASYTTQPSNAPGTSAASATANGPRRDRRDCGGSNSGPR